MTVRLGAFVITYRRTATVTDTVRRLLEQSRPPERILVIDNAASRETEDALRALADSRVEYQPMERNAGPAGAAACALARLRDQGFDWILWGDDDDPPRTGDTLERLVRLIASHDGPELGGVAAVGARWDWRRGETRRLADRELHGVLDVDAVGGNQCLIVRSAVLEDAGLPNPRLFFGLEEMEFCLRIRRAGYRLLVEGDLMRGHRQLAGRLGMEVRRRPARRHRPETLWRRYYNSRNYIFLMRHTFHRPDLARREAVKALVRTVAAWGGGLRYGWLYTRLQLAGVRDGFAERMGRTVEPSGYSEGSGS